MKLGSCVIATIVVMISGVREPTMDIPTYTVGVCDWGSYFGIWFRIKVKVGVELMAAA